MATKKTTKKTAVTTTTGVPRVQPTIPNPSGNFGLKVVNNNIEANNRRILSSTTTTAKPRVAPTTTMPRVAPTTTRVVAPPPTRPPVTVPPPKPPAAPTTAQKAALVKAALDRKAAADRAAAVAKAARARTAVVKAGAPPVTQVQGVAVPTPALNGSMSDASAAGRYMPQPTVPTTSLAPINEVLGPVRPNSIPVADWNMMTPAQQRTAITQVRQAQMGAVTSQTPFDTSGSTAGTTAGGAAAGSGGMFDTGISNEYNVLFDEGRRQEAERKTKYADLIDEMNRRNDENLKDLVVPTDEGDWTGIYDNAIGGLIDNRDQLYGDVNDLFKGQMGAIQQDQNRYLSSINSSGAAANNQIQSVSAKLQATLGIDKAAADQMAAQYGQYSATTKATAEQQAIDSNPLVQQQQAATAVQNAYRASGFTPQELAAMANQYAGKVAQSVASAKADAGYRYVDAYNEAFNNQKKSLTDIFSQFNTGLAQLLTGRTNAKSKFVAANQSGVQTRGDLNNKTLANISDALDKMERTDPYLARAMTDIAAKVRNDATIQGAAERNDASIAGRAALKAAGGGGSSGGRSGSAAKKGKTYFATGKNYWNEVAGVIGPQVSRVALGSLNAAEKQAKQDGGIPMNIAIKTIQQGVREKKFSPSVGRAAINHVRNATLGKKFPSRK